MKQLSTTLLLLFCAFSLNSQTIHQVCISEVYSTGACNSTSGVFTPSSLSIEVGDQIQFTTYMVLLGGYNGTHDIRFAGSPANNVLLPISTNALAPMTTVTTPPFASSGSFSMECVDGNHCLIADLLEGWPCNGYQVTVNPPCTSPDVPTLTASSLTICPGASSTINITGNLNDATNWHIYSSSCGTAQVGTTASSTFVVSPGVTTTYYIRGEDGAGCVDESTGLCSSITITVEDNPPTAICQNLTLSLDAAGSATIVAADVDNGSSDDCGAVSLSISQSSFNCSDISGGVAPNQSLIITGVIDGPLPGGLPKAIELKVANDIADLSFYGVGSANNGGGTDGEEFTFPAVSATQGQTIFIATEATEFTNFFGFAPDYVSASAPNINGDDAIELFYNSTVIDVFGDINMSGTGQPWEYLDGWVYRNDLTGPDGSVFVLGNWSFSGVSALAGETTNAAAAAPYPSNTFVASSNGTMVTLTVTDLSGNTSTCVSSVSIQDDMDPTASNPTAINVACIGDVPAADVLAVTDEADNCSIPVVAFVSDVSDGNTCPEIITRTYSVTDDSGNQIFVTQTITVNDIISPTASNPVAINVECTGNIPAPDVTVVTDESDNCSINPTVTFVSDVSDGLTCPETITRTYSVTDDCGNSILVTQIITVLDITSPVPNGSLSPITSSCDVTPTAPEASDNCDGTLIAVSDVTFPITAVGTTTVTWTYTDACGNQSIQNQDVTITAIDVSVTQNGSVLTADNNVGVTYQWIDCGNNNSWIVGESGQSYSATANGDYAVIITEAMTGCSDTSVCYNVNTIGIYESSIFSGIMIYPNPTTGIVSIDLGEEYDSINVEVKNVAGQIVNRLFYNNKSSFNLSINESDGVYFIELIVNQNSKSIFKVIKN